jgi:hypothetical protein
MDFLVDILALDGAQVISRRVRGTETEAAGNFGTRGRATLFNDAGADQFQDFGLVGG